MEYPPDTPLENSPLNKGKPTPAEEERHKQVVKCPTIFRAGEPSSSPPELEISKHEEGKLITSDLFRKSGYGPRANQSINPEGMLVDVEGTILSSKRTDQPNFGMNLRFIACNIFYLVFGLRSAWIWLLYPSWNIIFLEVNRDYSDGISYGT